MKNQELTEKIREQMKTWDSKLLTLYTLQTRVIAEFITQENEIRYQYYNEEGNPDSSWYKDFNECVIACILNLSINDRKILKMIMSLKEIQ